MAQTSSVGSGSDCPGRMEASPFMAGLAGCVDSGWELLVACLNQEDWEGGVSEVKSSRAVIGDRSPKGLLGRDWEAGTGRRDLGGLSSCVNACMVRIRGGAGSIEDPGGQKVPRL